MKKENTLSKEPYFGSFTIEVWRNADVAIAISNSTIIDGNLIKVTQGEASVGMGAIQFYAGNDPFCFGYRFVKKITAADGEVLWENWDEKE